MRKVRAMAAWSSQGQKTNAVQTRGTITITTTFKTRIALSALLFFSHCPCTLAVEAAQTAVPEASPKQVAPGQRQSRTALDIQLDKYQKQVDDNALTVDDFQKLADLAGQNPVNARVHLLLGRAFDMQGLADQAVEQYTIADKYGPKDPEAIASILHNILAKGGGEAANTLLNSAIKRFPDNPEILYMIGKRLKEQRHPVEAGKALSQAYRSGKKILGLPSTIGELIVDREPKKAIALANMDLATNADYAPALTVVAKALMFEENYSLALVPLAKLYQQSQANQDTTQMYLRSLYWCGDYRQALEPAYYCLLADSPYVAQDNHSANTLSKVLARLPESYGASCLQNFYEQVEKTQLTVNSPFHFYLGKVFFRLHRYSGAKAELLRYLDTDPKSAETLWMLGYIAENYNHDYATALKYYKLAHALLPLHPIIASSCRSLEERASDIHSDWAWCLRDWLYRTFSWGRH